MTNLRLELKPSRCLAAAMIVAHGAAAAGAAQTLDGWAMMLGLAGVTLSCLGGVGESLGLWPNSPVSVQLNEDSTGRWTDRRGNVRTASSIVVSYAATWLVVIGLRQSRGRIRWIVVPADSVAREDHRKLRLWARWRAA